MAVARLYRAARQRWPDSTPRAARPDGVGSTRVDDDSVEGAQAGHDDRIIADWRYSGLRIE